MPDVEDEIDRMKVVLGVELDRELAGVLDIDATAVAAWRRRDKIPEKYRVRYLRLNDLSAAPTSSGRFVPLREAYIFALISIASSRLSDMVAFGGPEREDFHLSWVGYRIAEFYYRLERRFHSEVAQDHLRADFDEIRDALRKSDNVEEWLSAFE